MNKVVLITGTSTGFGRTAAETLAQRGYTVFATMRDVSGLNAATSEALRSDSSVQIKAARLTIVNLTRLNSYANRVPPLGKRVFGLVDLPVIQEAARSSAYVDHSVQQRLIARSTSTLSLILPHCLPSC